MLTVIAEKEFKDNVTSKRFLILFGTLLLLSLISLWVGYNSYQERLESYVQGLAQFEAGIFIIFRQFQTNIILIGAILGIALGFDAITKEKEQGTLKVLLSHPVYKDQVILGKFLGGALTLGVAVVVITLTSLGMLWGLGANISGEDLLRVLLFMAFSYIYLLFFLGIGIAFSAFSKTSANSLMYSLVLFLVFMIIIPSVSSLIAEQMAGDAPSAPQVSREDNPQAWQIYAQELSEWQQKRFGIERTINSISPYHNFQEIGNYILNPYASSEGGVFERIRQIARNPELARQLAQQGGAQLEIERYSIGESLSFAKNNIVLLVIPLILSFVAGYLGFMRTDVR